MTSASDTDLLEQRQALVRRLCVQRLAIARRLEPGMDRRFPRSITMRVLLLLAPVAFLATACSGGSDHDRSGVSEQRAMLSEGYSMLYGDATKIDRLDLVLYVKTESKEFDRVITDISAFGDELKKDLERIARDYPGVRIDLEPLPEMERRKRFAVGKDRALRFAPLGGRSRMEYERTLLIGMSGALDQESHLCRVMAEEEPDPGLKKFLLKSERRYHGLHEVVMSLLNREHFKNNNNRPK